MRGKTPFQPNWQHVFMIAALLVVCCTITMALGGLECLPSLLYFGAADGEASAQIVTWNDENGDGIQDPDEPPLPWVTVAMDEYPKDLTNTLGEGYVSAFKPGCRCRCWSYATASALTPPGYRATTPTEVDLTGPVMTIAFGFQQIEAVQRPEFPGEPEWYNAFINRGLELQSFHFVVAKQRAIVVLRGSPGDRPSEPYEYVYRDFFDVIADLYDASVRFNKVSLRIEGKTDPRLCPANAYSQFGSISMTEVLEQDCEPDTDPQ